MSNDTPTDTKAKTPLTLGRGKLGLNKTEVETGQVRQSFSHGRSKVVQVERKRQRKFEIGADGKVLEVKAPIAAAPVKAEAPVKETAAHGTLTGAEQAHRLKVLQDALKQDEESRRIAEEEEKRRAAEEAARIEEEKRIAAEEAARAKAEAAQAAAAAPAPAPVAPKVPEGPAGVTRIVSEPRQVQVQTPAARAAALEEEEEEPRRKVPGKTGHKAPSPGRRGDARRREGKLTISAALDADDRVERSRSVAAMRRAVEKEKRKMQMMQSRPEKIVREVVLPETITVQELSNRMAERSVNVIKSLMKMGVMATINEVIDADTAELVAQEFGHTIKRVTDADVEDSLNIIPDDDHAHVTRPPVVTIMGHVDHGKTSLLDALRQTDVVSGEAGGITQHIGAYQVKTDKGIITFIDTPGHEAFTAMRARGAKVTDIVVLVVAADDGIMPQTIEAIRHAKAAEVPIIVAINKMDKPGANPGRVRQELLNHEIVVEEMGGETLSIEVSALKKTNLDKLVDAILLQAEVLDLKANPDREAAGAIIEAKMEKGVGPVGTVLIQRGTLSVGDIFVAGAQWGRVRILIDYNGKQIKEAGPSAPVEVVGFSGVPSAGDDFVVVADEAKAREISEFRTRKQRIAGQAGSVGATTMEQMFAKIKAGEAKELAIVIKADMQGSVEALTGTLNKIGSDEVKVNVIYGAVGAINESDVTLAKASNAVIIGFNVRANAQAREVAKRDGIDIRYYSIIYEVADEVKNVLTGMLSPKFKENFIGYAEIREVFNITKVGKVAGCRVTEGVIKRGCKVRLLRDNVVIHEGDLSQLKRFKDDAKEVREGYECGMALANYNDIQKGDMIECFELERVAATL
jgi:translation initiation factor IF-2